MCTDGLKITFFAHLSFLCGLVQMDVTMGPKAIKAFATAIQALSKIGKDLFIEADSEQVVLRALNDSKSAFSAVYLGAVSLLVWLLLPCYVCY